jgi:amino acid transporter
MKKFFKELCTPAKIYFAISILVAILTLFNGLVGIFHFLFKIFFTFVWALFLSWLCEKGYKTLSWALLLLPYIILMVAFLTFRNNLNDVKVIEVQVVK